MESDYKSNTMSFSKSRQTPNLLRIVFTITSRIVGVPAILLTSRIVGECSYSIRSRIIGSVFEHLFTSSAPIQACHSLSPPGETRNDDCSPLHSPKRCVRDPPKPLAVVKWYKINAFWYKPDPPGLGGS